MISLSILGATGSIGQSTLKIVDQFRNQFAVRALTAKGNVALLAEQIEAFDPELAVVGDEETADRLKKRLGSGCRAEILCGSNGYKAAATLDGVDMVVGAMVGAAGLVPTLAAIEAGKDIALANKETLVMAGAVVMKAVSEKGVRLLPVDSEHSAIFQCLQGQRRPEVDKILLTASGGPFRETPAERFIEIEPAQALQHPNWSMGAKITIDSATLMNKGLEVIEAKWLFDLSPEQIEVVVHPQSIVHSMVAFCDGSIIAQLGIPDMQGAIAYALSHPHRLELRQPLPDLVAIHTLTFESPNFNKFPCLRLAFDALKQGGTLPSVMNAANEIAVSAFLGGRIRFNDISVIIEKTMAEHSVDQAPGLDDILAADQWSRHKSQSKVEELATI